jgi:hypothetical protein
MMYAPLEGWRHVKMTDHRAAADYAHALKDLADAHFSDAKRIVLVQDNLNTYCPASLYEAFPAAEARRLVERFEWTVAVGGASLSMRTNTMVLRKSNMNAVASDSTARAAVIGSVFAITRAKRSTS